MSQESSSNRPRTRQRIAKPPPTLDVPDIDQDAAERKRVLNVLAQRRYRERRKQDRLKTKGKGKTGDVEGTGNGLQDEPACSSQPPPADVRVVSPSHPVISSSPGFAGGATSLLDLDLNWAAVDDGCLATLLPETTDDTPLTSSQSLPTTVSTMGIFSQSLRASPLVPIMGPMSMFMSDTSFNLDSSTPSLTDDNHHTSSSSSDPETTSEGSFPDSYLLPVNELTLLKALLRISTRIGVNEADVWNLDCPSPFHLGSGKPLEDLPAAWRPTSVQVTLPHHPVFDLIMPWPEARTRIITIMSLPDEARPPSARGPLAMVNFVYDFEDSAEGVRIYGSDPYDPGCWEVGQVLFERWWFLFDRAIIANSNRLRELRGAPPLRLKGS